MRPAWIIVSIMFTLITWIISIAIAVGECNFSSELRLADDASTPEQKAEYLGKFIDKVKQEEIAKYGAILFRNEQTKVSSQLVVLESLKKRCEDLNGLNKESMGYSQGMTQITGQEFGHAIDHIRGIFEEAWALQNFGIFIYTMSWWSWITVVITVVWWMVANPNRW